MIEFFGWAAEVRILTQEQYWLLSLVPSIQREEDNNYIDTLQECPTIDR
jgi:hypothetical protein